MNFPKNALTVFTVACVLSVNCEFVVNHSREVERSRRISRSLSTEVVNSTTITLRWSKEGNEASSSSSCPTRRYLVRLKTRGARRARIWEVDGEEQSANVPGLLPDTAYSVRLTVIDCEGRGKPTKWVTVHTTSSDQGPGAFNDGHTVSDLSLPGQPRKVTSKAFSDYVIVSWEPPDDDVNVRGYVIGYGEAVPDVNWQYVEGHRRNVTVKNLKKSTQYVISVRAFNSIGKGPIVYDLVFTRDSPPPSSGSLAAPTDLRTKVLSHATVWLQWTDPSLGARHPQNAPATDNRHYGVHYRALDAGSSGRGGGRGGEGGGGGGGDRSVIVKELHVVLYNLHPATEYEFKVTLVKDGLTSAFSNVVVNRTLETTPFSPPRSVTIARLGRGSSSVVVSWRPPKQPNGNITEYTVFYAQNADLPSDRWLTAIARQRTDLALQGLADDATYYFRVEARNSVGPGPKSDIVRLDGRTEPDATNIPSLASRDHVIAFSETEETEEDEYTDGDRDRHGDNIRSASLVHADSASVVKTKREPNLLPLLLPPMTPTTSDLDPQRQQQQQQQQQEPLLVRFHSVLSHRISAFITWPETPDCTPDRGPVTGYRLRYRRSTTGPPPRDAYVARGLADNVALVDDLAPNARYIYQVQYLMENGAETPWSQEQDLDTGTGL